MKSRHYIMAFVVFFTLYACTAKDHKLDVDPICHEPTISQDISFLDINDFAQDSLGYMWIATLGGLDRYNGYDFLHFVHQANDSTSLLNDFVLCLFIDSAHQLWVGTSCGLNRYNYEKKMF